MRIMEMNQRNEEEKEETEQEITLAKALEMVDKLKTYCLRKRIADTHSQVSEIYTNKTGDCLSVCLFICSAMGDQTARPNGLKFGG